MGSNSNQNSFLGHKRNLVFPNNDLWSMWKFHFPPSVVSHKWFFALCRKNSRPILENNESFAPMEVVIILHLHTRLLYWIFFQDSAYIITPSVQHPIIIIFLFPFLNNKKQFEWIKSNTRIASLKTKNT